MHTSPARFALPEGRTLAGAAALAVAYYATAQLGAAVAFPSAPVSALWFPNAIVLGALLLVPRRLWWIYLLAILPAHLLAQLPLPGIPLRQVAIQYALNCSTALIGALPLTFRTSGPPRFDRAKTALNLVLYGGVLAPLSTSVLMAAAFLAFDVSDQFWLTAFARALTNTFAILTLVPLIVHGARWLRCGRYVISPLRSAEAAMLALGLISAGVAAFIAPPGSNAAEPALLFLPLPMLLWAAVRFGVAGTCWAILALGVLATAGVLEGRGPFTSPSAAQNTVSMILLLVVTCVPLLLLAAALEERHALETARAASDARFRSTFEHNLIPTVIWRNGLVSEANAAFFNLTGYTAADVSAGHLRFESLTPGKAGHWGVDGRAEGIAAGDTHPIEYELTLRDGRRIPALIGGCRFPGDVDEGAAYAFDLSTARHAEAARRHVEVLHSAVLASIHDQIVVLDQNGNIIDANDSWRELDGGRLALPFADEQVGQDFIQRCVDAGATGDAVANNLGHALREVFSGRSMRSHLEYAVPGTQGATWFEVTIEPLKRPDGGAVIVWTDITSRKQAAEHARAQHEQLAHLGRAAVLGELSGAFAHELSQPLTSILGNAEAALQLLSGTSVDLREIRSMLGDIVADDVRAADVIQRLRSMLSRGEIERQPVDLNNVIRDVLELARSDLITRHVSVDMRLDTHVPLALGDRVQLQQVVLNLIVNACEAMSGIDVRHRKLFIATRFDRDSCEIMCTVRDRGCGIAGENIERIFQPFVTTKPQGMGMGLAICRSIIEAHGGRLWAENAADGGAAFHFTSRMSS